MNVRITRSTHADVPVGTRARVVITHRGGFGTVLSMPFGMPRRFETRICWFPADDCAHDDYQPAPALPLPLL